MNADLDSDTGLPKSISANIRGEFSKSAGEKGLGQTTDAFRSGEFFVLGYAAGPTFLYALLSEVSPSNGLSGCDYAPWPKRRFPGLVVVRLKKRETKVHLSGGLTLIYVSSDGVTSCATYGGPFDQFRDEIRPYYQDGVKTGNGHALAATVKGIVEREKKRAHHASEVTVRKLAATQG